MTNQELAECIGVSHSMASRIRNGKRLPGVETMYKLHRVFGIDPGTLMKCYLDGPESFGRLVRLNLP